MFNDKLKKMMSTAKDNILENAMLTSQIEIISNNHAIIQGARGVLEYDQNMIRINSISKQIQFWGDNFTIEYLSNDCIEIHGEISKIEFI